MFATLEIGPYDCVIVRLLEIRTNESTPQKVHFCPVAMEFTLRDGLVNQCQTAPLPGVDRGTKRN